MSISDKLYWHIKRKFHLGVYFLRFKFFPYVTIKGVKIPVSYKWSFPMLNALYKKEYEGGEIKIITQTLEKGDKVLEIGTGLGLISAFCAKKIGNKQVRTYEANPLLEKRIRKLYQINKVSPDLIVSLVSDKIGKVKFYVEPNNIWASSLLKLSETSMETDLVTIDINQVIKEFKPNYLIIDIEGAEYKLLPIIDFSSINKLQIELHKKFLGLEKINYLFSLLNKNGLNEIENLSTDEQYFFRK